MKKLILVLSLCLPLVLAACSFSIGPKTTTTAESTGATTMASETTAATSVPETTPTTAEPTTTAAETTTAPSQTSGDETQVLTGTFQGAEWGDYLHVYIKGDDNQDYSFFVLKYPGIDVEELDVGQRVQVTWQNIYKYLDPPGQTTNIDVALSIALIG
jgi:hypothetical protein